MLKTKKAIEGEITEFDGGYIITEKDLNKKKHK